MIAKSITMACLMTDMRIETNHSLYNVKLNAVYKLHSFIN